MTMLQPGQPAPAFSGPTQDGAPFSLADHAGRRVAVYFYPKDDTPSCTKQACSLRDGYRDLLAAGIAVVGVSPDDAGSHGRFAAKFSLPFPLVADADHVIAEAYGVWGDRSLYGRIFRGITRTTFLIGGDGRIVDVINRPDVGDHAAEVLARFEKAEAE